MHRSPALRGNYPLVAAIATCLLCIAWAQPVAAQAQVESTNLRHNLDKLNTYRAQHGVGALVLDDDLCNFALAGSNELMNDHAPHQHFKKAGEDGSLWTSGFKHNAAENQGDPHGWRPEAIDRAIDEILQMMMDEGPNGGHYKNILNPDFHRVGVGLVFDENGRLYFTNDFSE